MLRKKIKTKDPVWFTWEGDDFPRKIHSDSVVFYLSEHVYMDDHESYTRSLARQIQREGISYSLAEAYKLIEQGYVTKAGYYFEDGDESFPVYCEDEDPNWEWDATFVEVPFVY
jgi:hypothetical protein